MRRKSTVSSGSGWDNGSSSAGGEAAVRKLALHERLENKRQNFLHSVYIDNLNRAIQNCKSDVDTQSREVRRERTHLRQSQKQWGRFLKDEVHNLEEFNHVMEKFDQDMAKKGARIIELETLIKMETLKLNFLQKDLKSVENSREFVQQIAETQKMTEQQVLAQEAKKVIEFLQEFESWQIRKLEVIEEQDTLLQRLDKDLKQEARVQISKIESLKEKEQGVKARLERLEEATETKRAVCERFQQQMAEDDKFVSRDLTDIHRKLQLVESKTQKVAKDMGDRSRQRGDKSSIDLLKDVEKRVFYLLDLIDCLPKDTVDVKLAEIEKRKKISESRKWYADQEKERLGKLEKLKLKAAEPIRSKVGKPVVPMTMLKTQSEKVQELKNKRRREFEKTYFNVEDESSTSHDYF